MDNQPITKFECNVRMILVTLFFIVFGYLFLHQSNYISYETEFCLYPVEIVFFDIVSAKIYKTESNFSKLNRKIREYIKKKIFPK
jgi:hypothetical protein